LSDTQAGLDPEFLIFLALTRALSEPGLAEALRSMLSDEVTVLELGGGSGYTIDGPWTGWSGYTLAGALSGYIVAVSLSTPEDPK
jgi:hypothetical protein